MIGLLLSLAISASAAEVPFHIREAKSAKDVSSLNENFRATSDAIRRADLTNGGTVNGSLCFADGTCQTTAAISTAATVSTSSPGLWIEIASATVDAVSAYTFSGLSSTVPYRLEWSLFQNTSAGGYHLRFNGDTGGNYSTVLHETFTNGSEATEAGTTDTYCSLTDTATEVPKVGTGSMGYVDFTTVPTLPANRTAKGFSGWTENSITAGVTAETFCTHSGSGQLTSATITVVAGTATGYLSLLRRTRN